MTTAVQPASGGAVDRPSASGLADVIDTILDKGLVIDAYVRVSLVGIELLTIDARVVVASVDTYLRFAEATSRLDLGQADGQGLPELVQNVEKGGAKSKASGALEAAGDKVRDFVEDRGEERERAPRRRRRQEEE
jgi:hypothetical protein